MTDKTLLRPKDAREFLGVSETTFWRIRNTKNFPTPTYVSERIFFWRREAIEQWLTEQNADKE